MEKIKNLFRKKSKQEKIANSMTVSDLHTNIIGFMKRYNAGTAIALINGQPIKKFSYITDINDNKKIIRFNIESE
jgi:hypothetical protein